jgi:hypothetical protein
MMQQTTVAVPVAKNAVTESRKRPMTEADEFGAFARRILRAYSRRVADRDIDGLRGLVELRAEIDRAIGVAVDGLHGNPYSWTEIGSVLGITRQAAQQRFTRKD